MSHKIKNYLKLEKEVEQISHLSNIASLAHWDYATMLKPGSAKIRQQEMATLESLIHEMSTSQKFGDLIQAASLEEDLLDDWQKANLKLIKKSYEEEPDEDEIEMIQKLSKENKPTLDQLLDKISDEGFDSLTDEEKQLLKKYSQNMSKSINFEKFNILLEYRNRL